MGGAKSKDARSRRTRLPPAERRAQLLRCALSVFAERGLARAVHADVAKVADVAVSTVFLYFPTREKLVDAVLTEVERFYVELAEQVYSIDEPVIETIREHARRFRASIESHPDHALIWMNWSARPRSPDWGRYLELTERLVAIQRRTIQRGLDDGSVPSHVEPDAAARILIGYAQFTAQLKLSDFDDTRTSELGTTLVMAVLGAGQEAA